MAMRTIATCDRPGCGTDFSPPPDRAEVWIRLPPVANLGREEWELCPRCWEELRRARIDADLAFGDRLRPASPGPSVGGPGDGGEDTNSVATREAT